MTQKYGHVHTKAHSVATWALFYFFDFILALYRAVYNAQCPCFAADGC